MLRIEKYVGHDGDQSAKGVLRKLVLPFDLRQKSRFRTTLDDGTEAALYLPRGVLLRDGDFLEAEDGTLVMVVSAPENVLLVTAQTPHALMRAAYHLGNRHTRVEVGKDFLKLETDPVLQEMLLQLGMTVHEEYAPFQPEGGAYGGEHRHEHDRLSAEDVFSANQIVRGQDVHPDATRHAETHSHDDPDNHEHR
jgi:urease accessory protein